MHPEPTDGWGWMRQLFVLALLLNWLPRGPHVPELYSNEVLLLPVGMVPTYEHWVLSAPTAWGVYAVLLISGLALLAGLAGRLPALMVLVSSFVLVTAESVNIKAYDRLLMWHALALTLAPTTRRGLPGARYIVFIYMAGIYAATGWSKVLEEPAWWNGSALKYHLMHREFGMKPLGIFLSRYDFVMAPMSWITVIFEAAFPFLLPFWRVRRWLLLVGACFHIGTLLLMDVGSFWLVAIASYPALLAPRDIQALQDRLRKTPAGAALVRWVLRFQRDAVGDRTGSATGRRASAPAPSPDPEPGTG